MDDRRFDAWTRSLATGLSRRNVLKGVFGGAVLGGAAVTRVDRASAAHCGAGTSHCTDTLCCLDAHECCSGACCDGTCTTEGACCAIDAGEACGPTCCPHALVCCDEVCCDGACTTSGSCCAVDAGSVCGDNCCGHAFECCDGECCDPCEDVVCGDCETCEAGLCRPQLIRCEPGTVPCCIESASVCVDCCIDDQCGNCEVCVAGACTGACSENEHCCEVSGDEFACLECCVTEHCGGGCEVCSQGQCRICGEFEECCEGVCVDMGTCCPGFGEPCGGLVIIAEGGSPQLNCCDGLVCCETGDAGVCADCCGDHDCPKGTICCAGVCREIECCIDDILAGLDPNRRCSKDCTCFEGICVDPKTFERCLCRSDKDCQHGECCCKDGACSKHCCDVPVCNHDKDCPHGTCCCRDGSCSADCCKAPPDKPEEPKEPKEPVGGVKVDVLPSTGIGDGDSSANWLGAAALGAAAAYVAGKKLREEEAPATLSIEDE